MPVAFLPYSVFFSGEEQLGIRIKGPRAPNTTAIMAAERGVFSMALRLAVVAVVTTLTSSRIFYAG